VKREIQITIETERTIEVGGSDNADASWCAKCGAYTPMLSVEMAATLACLGSGAIYHWIQNAEFHYQQTDAGALRICQRSFLEHLKKLNFLPKPKRSGPPLQTAK
jgi:hypothetical protein